MAKEQNQRACNVLNKTSKKYDIQKQLKALSVSLQEMWFANRNMNPPTSLSSPLKYIAAATSNSYMWQRGFKIASQIGEPGHKDRLNFSRLALKIESRHSKGYPESEIVDAVLWDVTPGSQFHSYLEGKGTLMLPALCRMPLLRKRCNKIIQTYF